MIAVALVLIYLAVWKEYEPVLLLPIGFGCLLANLGMSNEVGFMKVIYDAGIKTEIFPLVIFIGVGAMIDFSLLLAQPSMVLWAPPASLAFMAPCFWRSRWAFR